MAAPQPPDDTKLSLLSRLAEEHFVGNETGRIYLATFFARQLSLGSANFEGFCISISTYSYNPLLSSCTVTDEHARARSLGRASPPGYTGPSMITPRFFRGFEFRFRPSREYVTTCFDTLISLNSSAGCCVLERSLHPTYAHCVYVCASVKKTIRSNRSKKLFRESFGSNSYSYNIINLTSCASNWFADRNE